MIREQFIKTFLQDSSNIYAENRLLRWGFVMVLMATVYNSYAITKITNRVQTHVIPVGGQGNFVISGSTASDDYLVAMGRYICHMSGDLTASTARQQLTELLSLFHETTYGEYRDRFQKIADGIERYASVSFDVQWSGEKKIKVTKDTITIPIIKKRIVGDTVKEKQQMSMEIQYVIEEGRFYLITLKEIGGESV